MTRGFCIALASAGLSWKRATMAAGSMPACSVADMPALTWSRSTLWMMEARPWWGSQQDGDSAAAWRQRQKQTQGCGF